MAMTTVTAQPMLRIPKRLPPPALLRLNQNISKGFSYEFPFRFPSLK